MNYVEWVEKPKREPDVSGSFWIDKENGDLWILSGTYGAQIGQDFRMMIRVKDGSRMPIYANLQHATDERHTLGYYRPFHGIISIDTEELK